MSDARGFMVAAYVLTVLTILCYGARLWMRRREVAGRLNAVRGPARPTQVGAPSPADADFDAEALIGGHHVQA